MKSVKSTLVFSILSMTVLAIPAPIASQSVHNHSKHHHYKVIDIGTFGGPESYIIPVQGVGSPNPVSSRGRAVGTAGTTTALDDYHNIICGGLEGGVPWVNQAFLAWKRSLINLGALGGDSSCSNGTSINTAGEIAGSSENGDIDPVLGLYELRAVRWRKRQIEDLKTLGGNHSMAGSINNHGQIAGFALNQTSDPYSMFEFQIFGISNGTQTRAALWDKHNNIQDLGTLGTGNDAWADFVNDRGQVAGFSYTTSTADPGTGVPPTHPFLWDPHVGKHGKMYDVGTLGGSSAGSIIINMQGALNDLGHVVGASFLKGDQDFHPYFWKKGEAIRDIGTLGGRCGAAEAMNDADEVAGRADVSGPCGQLDNKYTHNPLADVRGVNAVHSPAGNVSHAFLWKPGMKKPKDLGTVKGDQNSYATAINARHQIVGLSATESSGTYRAFLWESGGPMVDLNTLIPKNSSLYLNWAFDINDRGYIAGIGSPADCSDFDLCGHAFVLVPQ